MQIFFNLSARPILHYPTLLSLAVVLLLSWVSALPLRQKWLPGMVWGFLGLVAAADLSLFFLQSTGWPVRLILPLTVLGVALWAAVFRVIIPPEVKSVPPVNRVIFTVLAFGLGFFLYLLLTIRPEPAAGTQFFDAWNPLYIDGSFARGKFLQIADMALGRGFLTSAMHYAPNTLGLVAFLRSLGLHNTFVAYNSIHMLCSIFTLLLLLAIFRESRILMFSYFLLAVIFILRDIEVALLLGMNTSEEIIYLGGAFICYHLFQTPRGADRSVLIPATLSSLFLVFGRNYGAFYASIFMLTFSLLVFRQRIPDRKTLALLWAVFLIFSLRELVLLFTYGDVFYPRIAMSKVNPYSLTKFVQGSLVSWGLAGVNADGSLSVSLRSIWVLALIACLAFRWANRKTEPGRALYCLSPLIFLILPMLLEIITLYRKDITSSKLYNLGIWFFPWYTVFLLGNIRGFFSWGLNQPTEKTRARLVPAMQILLSVFFVTLVVIYPTKPMFRSLSQGLKSTWEYRFLNGDRICEKDLAKLIGDSLNPQELAELRQEKILYLHYEPGIGLRYYLGGDFFQDLDFWSEPVQKKLTPQTGLCESLDMIGCPNIYISLATKPLYQVLTDYQKATRFWEDLQNYPRQPCVQREFRTRDGIFLRTDKTRCRVLPQ